MTLPTGTPTNPFLIGEGIPPFPLLEPQWVEPALGELLPQLEQELATLEKEATATWEGLVDPLTRINERLSWTWKAIEHLMGVKNSTDLRQAQEKTQPQVVQFINALGQSEPLYLLFLELKQSPQWPQLSIARQRIVETFIRDAQLGGVGLQGAQRDRFNAIEVSLAELSTLFSHHVLDATKAFFLELTQPQDVEGLPSSLLAQGAQRAREGGHTQATAGQGPWRITLDAPSMGPFLKHSARRDLREKIYRAYVTRASQGDLNNWPLIENILALRHEQAQLLGFTTYAQLSLEKKMAPSVDAVETLLEELRSAALPAAQQELNKLQMFAQEHGFEGPLCQWDMDYWVERIREKEFNLKSEEMRPYFPLPQVLEGLFALTHRLFGVSVRLAPETPPLWHSDVRFYQVENAQKEPIAYFFLDPYSRPAEKRGGAWMDDCISRRKEPHTGALRLPVAYLVCNQTPPVDGHPSLMTFGEVETLFHEFGHGLQHLLTTVEEPEAAGINNIEWDAVELASQFMENWCYERKTFFAMARHYKTGEPLAEKEYQKLIAAKHFMGGTYLLRQVFFSLTDLALHHIYQPGGPQTPQNLRLHIAKNTTVIPPLPDDASLCSFLHIFSGGYAAGYYSYKWSEVLSADAFAAFEEAGLENEGALQRVGRLYAQTVLALGGSQHPSAVFKAFRGRDATTAALLRHSGL